MKWRDITTYKVGLILLACYWLYRGLSAFQTLTIAITCTQQSNPSLEATSDSSVALWAMMYFCAGWLMMGGFAIVGYFFKRKNLSLEAEVMIMILVGVLMSIIVLSFRMRELAVFLASGACFALASAAINGSKPAEQKTEAPTNHE